MAFLCIVTDEKRARWFDSILPGVRRNEIKNDLVFLAKDAGEDKKIYALNGGNFWYKGTYKKLVLVVKE